MGPADLNPVETQMEDPEAIAMNEIAGAMARLEELEEDARARVLTWMVSRWGPFPGAQERYRRAPAAEAPYREGQALEVELTAQGRRDLQAVGYLEDGNMVVVEDARHLIGTRARVEVTATRPQSRGRWIVFARVAEGEEERW